MALVEAYSYADTAGLQSTSKITVTLNVTGTPIGPFDYLPTEPLAFLDLLAWWTAQGGLTFAYDAAADRVTVSTSSGDPFALDFSAAVGAFIGFSSPVTGATSYTGDLPPGGICPVASADIGPPIPMERAELHRFEHGRAMATVWQTMRQRTCGLTYEDDGTERLGGWLVSGRIRVTDDAGVELDGFVVAETSIDTKGMAEGWLIRELQLVQPTDGDLSSVRAVSGLWGAHLYGWGCMYVAYVAGVPVAWTQRTLFGADPGRWATLRSGDLSIGQSAELGVDIDRQRGIGAGLSLSFELTDSDLTKFYLQRPTLRTALTQPLDWNDTTAYVEDTTGWPSSGQLYIGAESMLYAGKTGTSFTGLTRGMDGSLPMSYATGYINQAVTDKPQQWRGRLVELWAVPLDPSGRLVSPDLTLDGVASQQVFVGALEGPPQRTRTGFAFEAQSVDRLLDRELAGEITGTVIPARFVLADPGWVIRIGVRGYDGSAATVYDNELVIAPFEGIAVGAAFAAQDFLNRVQNAWYLAVTAAGLTSYLLTSLWLQDLESVVYLSPIFKHNSGVVYVDYYMSAGGTEVAGGGENLPNAYGLTDDYRPYEWLILQGANLLVGNNQPVANNLSLAFVPESGDPTAVPASGVLRLISGDLKRDARYATAVTDGDVVYVSGVQLLGTAAKSPNLVGMTVKVAGLVTGTAADLVAQLVTSTGSGDNGAADLLPQGQGLGLPADLLGDLSLLSQSPTMEAWAAGASVGALLSGWLALRRLGLVLRHSGRYLKLTAVPIDAGGVDWYEVITDQDLLGWGDEPVIEVERLAAPNALEVSRKTTDEAADDEPVVVIDHLAVQYEGRNSWELELPLVSREALHSEVLTYGPPLLSQDRTAQAVKLRLPPWIAIAPGDCVYLDGLTHPLLWQWSTATPGYTGPARVTGLQRDHIRGGIQTVTLLIDGSIAGTSLAPAFPVSAFTLVLGAIATITIAGTDYLPHLVQALAQSTTTVVILGTTYRLAVLLHYQPGTTEGTAQTVTYREVAEVSGNTVLTIHASSGTTLSTATATQSWLTLPHLGGSGNDYQDAFAHVDDGSYWGA